MSWVGSEGKVFDVAGRLPSPKQQQQPVNANKEGRKKTAREMWEEDEAIRKAQPVVPLEMGTAPMCAVGGCGYFSDDDK